MNKLQNIYYQPNHLWKGQKAIRKLKDLSKENKQLLSNGCLDKLSGKVHLPPPKCVDRPHYEVMAPNEMHQFDLLYMPSNTLYGNKFQYIMSGINVISRYKVTRPLRTKQAEDVAKIIADIYRVGPLTFPKV